MEGRIYSLALGVFLLLPLVQFSNAELDLSNLGDQIQQGFNNLHLDDAIKNLNITGRVQGFVEDKIQGVVNRVQEGVNDTIIQPVNDLKDKLDCAKDNLLKLDPEAAARCQELNSGSRNMVGGNMVVVVVVAVVGMVVVRNVG